MRILIVEDETRIADFLQRGLGAEGHFCVVANDGESGLSLALDGDFAECLTVMWHLVAVLVDYPQVAGTHQLDALARFYLRPLPYGKVAMLGQCLAVGFADIDDGLCARIGLLGHFALLDELR